MCSNRDNVIEVVRVTERVRQMSAVHLEAKYSELPNFRLTFIIIYSCITFWMNLMLVLKWSHAYFVYFYIQKHPPCLKKWLTQTFIHSLVLVTPQALYWWLAGIATSIQISKTGVEMSCFCEVPGEVNPYEILDPALPAYACFLTLSEDTKMASHPNIREVVCTFSAWSRNAQCTHKMVPNTLSLKALRECESVRNTWLRVGCLQENLGVWAQPKFIVFLKALIYLVSA